MALIKRGNIWHYDFQKHGRRYQGSTKCEDHDAAEAFQAQLKRRKVPCIIPSGMPDPGVYFIQSKATGLTKIGCSLNIEKRVADIQSMSPDTLNLVGRIRTHDYCEAERIMHLQFFEKRVRGEWFRIEVSDVKYAIKFWREFRDRIAGKTKGRDRKTVTVTPIEHLEGLA